MTSRSLWLSALTNALISGAWGVLALQRYRQNIKSFRLQEDFLDLSASSEGS